MSKLSERKKKGHQGTRSFLAFEDAVSTGQPREEYWSQVGQFALFVWERNELTNININVENTTFKAHRLVLGCRSKYFSDMFREKGINLREVTLDGYSCDVFEKLLRFMYTGDIEIDFEKSEFVELYQIACDLEVFNIIALCENHIEDLAAVNIWIALSLAKSHNLTNIYKKLWNLLRSQFLCKVLEEGFLLWELENVASLLCDDFIAINSELDVFRSALWWIDYDRPNRIDYATTLMDCVRFPLMSFEELYTSGVEAAYLMEFRDLRDILPYSYWFQNCSQTGKQQLPNFPAYNDNLRSGYLEDLNRRSITPTYKYPHPLANMLKSHGRTAEQQYNLDQQRTSKSALTLSTGCRSLQGRIGSSGPTFRAKDKPPYAPRLQLPESSQDRFPLNSPRLQTMEGFQERCPQTGFQERCPQTGFQERCPQTGFQERCPQTRYSSSKISQPMAPIRSAPENNIFQERVLTNVSARSMPGCRQNKGRCENPLQFSLSEEELESEMVQTFKSKKKEGGKPWQ